MIKDLILPVVAVAILVQVCGLIAYQAQETDQRMQHAEQACTAKGGVLIDTSAGYKCYNRGEEAL